MPVRPLSAAVLALALAGCLDAAAPPPGPGVTYAPPPGPVWLAHAEGPTPRTEVQVAAIGERLFTIGGFTIDGAARATVDVYDATSDAWSRAPDYPFAVHHHAAVATEDAVYVLGGFASGSVPSGDLPVFGAPTALAFKLAAGAERWEPIAPLPEARGAHAAALLDDKIYVFGGYDPAFQLLASVHVYDVAADAWSAVADLPTPRDHLAATALAGKVYAVAGQFLSHDDNTDAFEAFDPETGAWEKLSPVPLARDGLAAVAHEGRVIALGGQDGSRTHAQVDAYDPASGAWARLPDLPTARHGLGAASWGGRVYALLGGPEPGLSVTGRVESLGPPSA